jgi:hypothetical protein
VTSSGWWQETAGPPDAPDEGSVENGDNTMPNRLVGGAVQPAQVQFWQEEGLPTRCPNHKAVFKFKYVEKFFRWECPVQPCSAYVELADFYRSTDGGDVWW